MKLIAKVAMVATILILFLDFVLSWPSEIFGATNEIWDFYDYEIQVEAPPLLIRVLGACFSFALLVFSAIAFFAIWKILDGGPGQDFRKLAGYLKRTGLALSGVWLAFNLEVGLVAYLLLGYLPDEEAAEFFYAPIDLDLIFLIIAIALLAISQTLHRAWEAEEENKQFV